MEKQTRRNMSWAAGALLAIATSFTAACGGGDSPSDPVAATGGTGTTGGTGGSTFTGGTSGASGTSGTGSTGGTGGNTGGSAGTSGTGGTDADAGGASGGAGDDGGAGYSSHPILDGGDAEAGAAGAAGVGGSSGDGGSAGDGGTGGTAGTGGEAGSGGTSGTGGSSGAGGTAGTGGSAGSAGSGSGGTGGTMVLPCPSDCSSHGTCDTSTGVCACDDGFDGPACDECAADYKNYPSCYAPIACPSNCSGHGTCNDQTGSCTCSTGYDGSACSVCEAGYTGYPVCVVPPQPFTCQNHSRSAGFDALKIDGGSVWLLGGLWGTSGSNMYVSCGTYTRGGVCRYNGTSWTYADLPNTPMVVGNVWGTSDSDVWIPARIGAQTAALYHKTGSGWVQDPNQPTAWEFNHIWGPDSNTAYLTGRGGSFPPKPMMWKKTGTSWSAVTLPSFPGTVRYTNVWGIGANHVFLTGYYDENVDGNSDHGFLVYFNGSTWTSLPVPADCTELADINGTSFDDLYVIGSRTEGGVIYHITNGLANWQTIVNDGVDPGVIWSKRAGTALALGTKPPAGDGALRMTTIDEVGAPLIQSVDSVAYGPVKIWAEPGTDTVHFVTISPPSQNTPAAFYTTHCD